MKGVQGLGVLVIGVVWGCLVTSKAIGKRQTQPWLIELARQGETDELDLPQCIGKKIRPHNRGLVTMTMGERWRWNFGRSVDWQKLDRNGLNFEVKERYRHLWLSGIASTCAKDNVGADVIVGEKRQWCILYANGKGINMALRCSHEEHADQFKEWSELVQNLGDGKNESVVTFKEANITHQNFLCELPQEYQKIDASEGMPKYRQQIEKRDCELDDNETSRYEFANNCYYNMKWLEEKVATYRCQLPSPRNCEEEIKRTFEENNKGNFKAREAKVEEEGNKPEQHSLETKTCEPHPDSPRTGREGMLKFKFTNGTDKEKTGEIWCTLKLSGQPNKIACKFIPKCEVEIRNAFEKEISTENFVSVSDTAGKEIKLADAGCTAKERQNSGEQAFSFSFRSGNPPDGELSCIHETPGNLIKCTFSPTCAYRVKKTLGTVEPEDENFDGSVEGKEGLNLNNATCTETQITRGECKPTFQIITKNGDNVPENGRIEVSCHKEDGAVKCEELPQCETLIKSKFKKLSIPPTIFDGQVADQEKSGQREALTGFTQCKAHADNPSQTPPNGQDELKFTAITKDGLNRTFSCKNGGDSKISCQLLPKTCEQFVQTKFKETCQRSPNFESGKVQIVGEVDRVKNKNEDAECPLVAFPPNSENCRNEKNALTFRISEGKEANKTLSCIFGKGGIKCKIVALTCAQSIQVSFTKKHHHSSENFDNLVAMDPKVEDLELTKASCEETNEKEDENEKIFKITSENNGAREVLCQNGKPKISCSPLPPRCKVEKYAGNNQKPLRCDEKDENITISGGNFEGKEITCGEKKPENNAEVEKKCKITVKNGESKTYYCENEEAKKLGENVCTTVDKLNATSCGIENLDFGNKECKNEEVGEISIPASLLLSFKEEMKKLKRKCNETNNNHEIEKEMCSVRVDLSGKESFLHCPKDEVKRLQEQLARICKNDIPQYVTLHSGRNEEKVRIHIQSEETTNDKDVATKIEKIMISRPTLEAPLPWDIDDFASSYYSSLSLLLIALF